MTSAAATMPASPAISASTAAAYREHADRVWSCLGRLGLVGHDREDALQEVFLVVHRRWASFEGRAAVGTWIYGIAVRVAIDHLRRRRALAQRTVDDEVDPIDPDLDPHAIVEHREALAVLDALLGELAQDQRNVFVLSDVEGLPVPAVAELLALNVRTAYSRLRVARADFERAMVRWQARRAHVEDPPAALARMRRANRERVPPQVWAGIVVALELPTKAIGMLTGLGAVKLGAAIATVVALGVGASASVDPPHTVARVDAPAVPVARAIVATGPVPPPAPNPIAPPKAKPQPRARDRSEVTTPTVAPTPDDRVATEVERLRSARAALRAGRATDAWVRLQGDAPVPELAEARTLLRIEILCALGRFDDARTEARSTADPDARLAERCPAARG
ncbi:MAG TPA: sigma-70 family RNA polymerase sigma factor [Nannocystaceae bacterium]|nr:sigma-70 family RNA polymerase sigma factor [Nannocystaceae bacterium]